MLLVEGGVERGRYCSDEEIAYPVEGEALVIRRALNM